MVTAGDAVPFPAPGAMAPRARQPSTRRPGWQDVFQRASATAGEAGAGEGGGPRHGKDLCRPAGLAPRLTALRKWGRLPRREGVSRHPGDTASVCTATRRSDPGAGKRPSPIGRDRSDGWLAAQPLATLNSTPWATRVPLGGAIPWPGRAIGGDSSLGGRPGRRRTAWPRTRVGLQVRVSQPKRTAYGLSRSEACGSFPAGFGHPVG